jgi:hypothetical protein
MIYTCDRCDQRVTAETVEKGKFYQVGVHIQSSYSTNLRQEHRRSCSYTDDSPSYPHQQWCEACVKQIGLLGFSKPIPGEPEKTPPTLDDVFREMIDDVVADAVRHAMER